MSECMESVGWRQTNWCLHRSAWHESNASKHLTLPRFVPHRKLLSLHDIGWSFHANTTTSPTLPMLTDHAASDLDSPALPASLFHRLGQHVDTCETLRSMWFSLSICNIMSYESFVRFESSIPRVNLSSIQSYPARMAWLFS